MTQSRHLVIGSVGSAGPGGPSSGSIDPSPKSSLLVLAQPFATCANSGACSTGRQMFYCTPWVGAVPFGCRGPSGPKFCHALTAPEPKSECITEPGPGGQRRRASSFPLAAGQGWTRALRAPPAPWPGEEVGASEARPSARRPWALSAGRPTPPYPSLQSLASPTPNSPSTAPS